MSTMEIDNHKNAIYELIVNNNIVSLIAPTGSGKSLGVPNFLGENNIKTFITVPTRTGAISLANRQRELLKDSNVSVGHAAEGYIGYNYNTTIVYATSGHIRKKMLSYFEHGKAQDIDFCTVLFVDEIHSGSIDNTIILSLWVEAARQEKLVPRLLIASATPVDPGLPYEIASYEVEIRLFNIDYFYLPKDIKSDENLLYMETAQLVANLHNNNPVSDGHILVFAAGASEISDIVANLDNLFINVDNKPLIYMAHGTLPEEEVQKIYLDVPEGMRKIIVATNIAETSITVPFVGFVVDTMLEKRAETSASGGFRLTTTYISKDSAKQRAGRTGRTNEGKCYRMCTQEFYNNLEEHRPAEIDRIPLNDVIMELLDVGLSPSRVLLNANSSKIQTAITLLNNLNMIVKSGENVTVTDSGHFSTSFPLSVRNAKFLYDWLNYKGLRFDNKTIIDAAKLEGIDYEKLEVDVTSYYSCSQPNQLIQSREFFSKEIKQQPKIIIDATANIGADTLHFARMYPSAQIIALEKNANIAKILKRNTENVTLINKKPIDIPITVYNTSAVDYFNTDRYADIIYFDPEWGGCDYHKQPSLDLFLDDVHLGDAINNIMTRGMTPLVIVKLPFNINMNNIKTRITQNVRYVKYDVKLGSGNTYILLFIHNNNEEYNGKSINTLLDNEPNEVQLTSPSYPSFPGVVTACLIDAYGPPYFWTPRRNDKETNADYRKRVFAHKMKYFEKFRGESDLHTILNIWRDLYGELGYDPRISDVNGWASENSINAKKYREFLQILYQCINRVLDKGYQVRIGPFNSDNVVKAAAPLLAKSYFDRIMVNNGNEYIDILTNQTYTLDTRDTVNNFESNPPEALLGLVTAEIKSARGVSRMINVGVVTSAPQIKFQKPRSKLPISSSSSSSRPKVPMSSQGITKPSSGSNMSAMLKKFGNKSLSNTAILSRNLGPIFNMSQGGIVKYSDISNFTAGDIVQVMKNNRLGFPYKVGISNQNDIIEAFTALYNYNGTFSNSPNEINGFQVPNILTPMYLELDTNTDDIYEIDTLADFYTEGQLVKCSNTLAIWNKYDKELINVISTILTNQQDLSRKSIAKEWRRKISIVNDCIGSSTTFLHVLIKFLNIENPHILDLNPKNGASLVASLSLVVPRYVAIDPNGDIVSPYRQLANFLGKMVFDDDFIENYYTFIADSNNLNENFDIIFTDTSNMKVFELLNENGYIISTKYLGDLSIFGNYYNCGIITGDHLYYIWTKISTQTVQEINPSDVSQQNLPLSLNKEYARYLTIRQMVNYGVEQGADEYKYGNICERWLLGMVQDLPTANDTDQIFSMAKLQENHHATKEFIAALRRNDMDSVSIFNGCKKLIIGYLQTDKYDEIGYNFVDNKLTVGSVSFEYDPSRLEILRLYASDYDIAIMTMRYLCLLPRGNQWAVPDAVYRYLYENYGNKDNYVEGFASPLNSRMLMIDEQGGRFCSIFPDTDTKFGSVGSFFNIVFDSCTLTINPPFIMDIMNSAADHIINCLDKSTDLQCVFCVPYWPDADYYTRLVNSTYHRHTIILEKKQHRYIDTTNSNVSITAQFDSVLIFLTTSPDNTNYELLTDSIRVAFSP